MATSNAATRYPWLSHYEPGVPSSISYPATTLDSLLDTTVQRFPDRTATVFFGGRLSFRELIDQVNRFAAALRGLGVKKGDRVAIFLPNCPQFVIAFYGALRLGAVVVPTNPLYVERELEHQMKDSGAETIVTLSAFYKLVEQVRPRTALKRVIVCNIKEYFSPVLRVLFTLAKEKKEGHRVDLPEGNGVYRFRSLLDSAQREPMASAAVGDDLALLQYTGGTTGLSKGAMLTHRNLVSNTMQLRHWIPSATEGKETMFSVMPFFHVYGLTVCMSYSIYLGATMILLPRFELESVLKALDKHKPTFFPGVPTMYVAINGHPQVRRYDLRSIRYCISGAAPLPVEVQTRFEELTGGRLVEGYGLTEAAPVTHCNPMDGLRKPGSIGVPFPDVQARIVDTASGETELPAGEIGELVLQGPQVMQGYWQQPSETQDVLRDGWLHTGDIARMDEDGYFYIVDRKKDIIIAGGYNIYPRDVEEVLFQHPKVLEAVVVGVPDEYRGETVKAYVVLKPGESASEVELIAYCQEKVARYKVPTTVEFRDSLPKTLVGKYLRRALREEELSRRAATSGTNPESR
ncbi:MAG: long-chain fatty acid--CoA ligase [Chloroflexota bacterium]|nr:MAG: long-chain fatty acid--CoA ligase [Chloroflexota bacterium]